MKKDGIKVLDIDGDKYQLIFFPSGSVPEINIKLDKLMFFMYQHKFEKIYYCGIHHFKNLTETTINDFLKNHCFNNTNKFIDFKNLTR